MGGGLLSPTGIIGFIGVIAAGFAVALLGTVRALRENLSDARARNKDLEDERDDYKQKYLDEVAGHALTKADLETMTRTVTGEAHWVALEVLVHDVIDRIKALTTLVDSFRRGPR